MRPLRTTILAFAMIASVSSLAFGSVEPISTPLGYKDWKASRVNEARAALEKVQVELDPNLSKAQPKSAQKPQKRDNRLSQAQNNLAIAQELGAHDYFVLYLSQLKESEIQEAVKKLDSSEVADIVIGIKKHQSAEVPAEPILPITTPNPNGQKTSRNP